MSSLHLFKGCFTQCTKRPLLAPVLRVQHILLNYFTTDATKTEGEMRIINIVKDHMNVHDFDVQDISGGCGSMYEVFVSSSDFKGKRRIQQHRMITEILKDEVKEMHGLRIHTEVPGDGPS